MQGAYLGDAVSHLPFFWAWAYWEENPWDREHESKGHPDPDRVRTAIVVLNFSLVTLKSWIALPERVAEFKQQEKNRARGVYAEL